MNRSCPVTEPFGRFNWPDKFEVMCWDCWPVVRPGLYRPLHLPNPTTRLYRKEPFDADRDRVALFFERYGAPVGVISSSACRRRCGTRRIFCRDPAICPRPTMYRIRYASTF